VPLSAGSVCSAGETHKIIKRTNCHRRKYTRKKKKEKREKNKKYHKTLGSRNSGSQRGFSRSGVQCRAQGQPEGRKEGGGGAAAGLPPRQIGVHLGTIATALAGNIPA